MYTTEEFAWQSIKYKYKQDALNAAIKHANDNNLEIVNIESIGQYNGSYAVVYKEKQSVNGFRICAVSNDDMKGYIKAIEDTINKVAKDTPFSNYSISHSTSIHPVFHNSILYSALITFTIL